MNTPDQPPVFPATPQPSVAQATEAVLADLEQAAEALKRAQAALRE